MNVGTVEYLSVSAVLFVFGAVVGSYLNVCIYRLPREQRFWRALRSLVSPPSHCPRCLREIPFYDNIPILGWLILRGRCRNCQGRISIRYPLVELLTAVLFVLLYWCEVSDWYSGPRASTLYHVYGPAGTGWFTPLAALHARYLFHLALLVALLAATFIDIDLKIIPDTVTLPAMAVGVLGNALLGPGQAYIVPLWYQTPAMALHFPLEARHLLLSGTHVGSASGWLAAWSSYSGVPAWMGAHPLAHGLLVSLAGIVAGGGIVWGVRIAGFWGLKKEAMGFGDVVLLAMIGSFLGWQAALAVFFIAPLCALVSVAISAVFRVHREIPYGPYLSLATLLLLAGWQSLWPYAEATLSLGPFLPVAGVVLLTMLAGSLRLVRVVQILLGFRVDEPEWVGEWTSADQLFHFSGERLDQRHGEWRRRGAWRGETAGRGLAHWQDWRHGGR